MKLSSDSCGFHHFLAEANPKTLQKIFDFFLKKINNDWRGLIHKTYRILFKLLLMKKTLTSSKQITNYLLVDHYTCKSFLALRRVQNIEPLTPTVSYSNRNLFYRSATKYYVTNRKEWWWKQTTYPTNLNVFSSKTENHQGTNYKYLPYAWEINLKQTKPHNAPKIGCSDALNIRKIYMNLLHKLDTRSIHKEHIKAYRPTLSNSDDDSYTSTLSMYLIMW